MERIVLTASEGMVYTDGVHGGRVVYLAEGQSADGWNQVSREAFLQQLEHGGATQDDYHAALAEFGVEL